MSDALPLGSNYTMGPTLASVESSPFQLPNATVLAGSDNADSAKEETSKPDAKGNYLTDVVGMFFPVPVNPQKVAADPKVQGTIKAIVYSVLFVVIGLMLLSRGFGLIGEEGSDVLVNLGDPAKFPGIGHAVRGIKGKR